MLTIWNDYLYQPLFNFLIWVYNNWTDQNLGWAIVYLTIILRTALLPFTLVSERNRVRNEDLVQEVKDVQKSYANDPILQKEEVRKVLRKRKVQPWAKVVTLGMQLLVLVLLYQVFLRGITGEKLLKILYPTIAFPGKIETIFYGFELEARYGYVFPGIVTTMLFLEIYLEFRKRETPLNKGDLAYFVLFPIGVFIVLWTLPMVKALFILTSMVFSIIIGWLSRGMFRSIKNKAKPA